MQYDEERGPDHGDGEDVAWAPRRRAILDAARARFAEDGYERATIRAIAADAGVDPAMVMRYYGSKSELFAATVRAAADLGDLSQVPRDEVGVRFARAMLGRWERGENDAEAAMLRAAPTHPEGPRIIQTTFDRRILPALAAAFPDDPDIRTRAGLVAAQGLGVALCRYVLRVEPLASTDYELVIEQVGASIQRYLTAPLTSAP
jgi:AcrR family transcriptional regulator